VKVFLILRMTHFYVRLFLHSKGVTGVGVGGDNVGRKFDDIMGNSRKLHKEEHHNVCPR